MGRILGYTKDQLKQKGAIITASEIMSQPKLWSEVFELIKSRKQEIEKFIDNVQKVEGLRIIFAGAGSSNFLGECVVPYLNKKLSVRVEAIPTTHIVEQPLYYLEKETPTLLISCARSGNSPESVTTVELAQEIVEDLYQIVLTCNEEGDLFKNAYSGDRNLCILMPNQANDQGYAMTASVSCMILASLLIFNLDELNHIRMEFEQIITKGEKILENSVALFKDLSELDMRRTVYIGGGMFLGLAKESALKLLELTAGKIATSYNTCLGFRHGPKFIIDDQTLIVIYFSNDSYARKYEYDLLKEVYLQRGNHKVLAITDYKDDVIEKNSDYCIYINHEKQECSKDYYTLFEYLLNAQIFALYRSIQLGNKPDTPSVDGKVNRVVKGVTIYPFPYKKF